MSALHFRHEEGRFMLQSGTQLLTEFEVRDHLGNVRQVLRSPETQTWMATLEQESAWHEEEDFDHLPESRQQDYRHNSTPGGTQVAWLNAARGRSLGPVRYQEVQRGQFLQFSVRGKFESPENRLILPLVGSMFSSSGAFASGMSVDGGTGLGSGGLGLGLFAFLQAVVMDLGKQAPPAAYMHYVLYDRDSVKVREGRQLLSSSARNKHELLEDSVQVTSDGYLELYVLNETSQDAWFDDLTVSQSGPIIVQERHYYPFGLQLSGLSYDYQGHDNRYLYNGKELVDDLNLNLYDYGARFYDPVIGRWTSPDPLASERSWVSPYNYVQNNPMLRVDPDGRLDDYYSIVNDELVYLGNDGQGNNIRLVSEGQHEQALSNLNGVNTTDTQRATLRNGNLSQVVTFNEGNIQNEFQGVNDRTITNQLENSVTITLDPATATVDAQPGAQGTATAVTNTYNSYNGSSGMWTNGGANLVLGDGHGHPTVTTPGMKNAPGYSKTDSNTAGSSGIATYTIDSYNSRVGGAATIHQARPGGRAGTNPVGTTQNTNGIGRRSFLHTARPYKP